MTEADANKPPARVPWPPLLIAGALILGQGLDRLTGGVTERPDRPDAWVTAIRRLPALDARFAPFNEGIDKRLRDVLRQRGIEQLYSHQAMAIEHALGASLGTSSRGIWRNQADDLSDLLLTAYEASQRRRDV